MVNDTVLRLLDRLSRGWLSSGTPFCKDSSTKLVSAKIWPPVRRQGAPADKPQDRGPTKPRHPAADRAEDRLHKEIFVAEDIEERHGTMAGIQLGPVAMVLVAFRYLSARRAPSATCPGSVRSGPAGRGREVLTDDAVEAAVGEERHDAGPAAFGGRGVGDQTIEQRGVG